MYNTYSTYTNIIHYIQVHVVICVWGEGGCIFNHMYIYIEFYGCPKSLRILECVAIVPIRVHIDDL